MHRWFPKQLQSLLARIKTSPLASRLARGSFWSLAGSVSSRVLALGAAVVAARILGKATYGELGIIQSTVSMFGTLAGFGLGTTATKYVAEFRANNPSKAGRIIALTSVISWGTSSLLALVMVVLAPVLATRSLAAPHLAGSLQLGAILLLLNAINGAQNGVLSGFEAFRSIARISLVTGLLNFPLVLAGAYFFGLPGLIWGMVLAQGTGCLLNFLSARRQAALHNVPICYSTWRAEFWVIWRFALPAVLGNLLIGPVTWLCSAMLARQPQGYEHMGAFNAASQWFNALLWLPYMFGGVILPLLSERLSARDHERSAKLLLAAIKMNAVAVFPFVFLGGLLSPFIMAVYGEGFRSEWPTLVAILAAAGVLSIQVPVGVVIAASGRMWMGLLMNFGWATALITATWLFLPWGALGLASAQLVAYLIHAIWTFAYAMRVIRAGATLHPSQPVQSR